MRLLLLLLHLCCRALLPQYSMLMVGSSAIVVVTAMQAWVGAAAHGRGGTWTHLVKTGTGAE